MLTSRFSLFGFNTATKSDKSLFKSPALKLRTDKEVYRPGDPVTVTIDIVVNNVDDGDVDSVASVLVERLSFELKGVQKLDTQWFNTHGAARNRRGEHVFLDTSTESLVKNHIVSSSATKSYVVRTVLPEIVPPSYKGFTIRYLYYVKSVLSGRWLSLNNGQTHGETTEDFGQVEARIPFQVWVTQQNSSMLMEEGTFPTTSVPMDIYWKEKDGETEWARANDNYDVVDEGYDSSKDDISSVSSYNLGKENIHKTFGSSLSLQSSAPRSSFKDAPNFEGDRTSLSTNVLPQLSVSEVLYDSGSDILSTQKSTTIVSPSQQRSLTKDFGADYDTGTSTALTGPTNEPVASEGFIRGRSYNIRLDDQVLLRFSPKKSDSTYYFSDMIGGTLTFFHEEGSRRCLEISITLETSETIDRRLVHPSRRNSLTLTKVQSDHYQVVADLIQTSFLFSIPADGPMSFTTPQISVKWSLRFEFFTTPKTVDWSRYEHPLMVEGRDKCEWVLPITVHAPPPRTSSALARSEKPLSIEPLWVRS